MLLTLGQAVDVRNPSNNALRYWGKLERKVLCFPFSIQILLEQPPKY